MEKSAEWALSLSYTLISLSFFAELAMPCGKMNLPQRVNKQVPRGEERHEIITHISFPDAIVKCNIAEEGHFAVELLKDILTIHVFSSSSAYERALGCVTLPMAREGACTRDHAT